MGIRGSWDRESNEDDSMVSEDRPWLPRSSNPDVGAGEYFSPEDDDSEESSTPRAIKTRNEGPKSNAALNLAARTYRNKRKEDKGETFCSPTTQNTTTVQKIKSETRKRKLAYW